MKDQQPDPSRRQFLGTAATALAGLTVAPGVVLYEIAQARPADQPVTDARPRRTNGEYCHATWGFPGVFAL